ncbi:MAG: hypothetical protein P8L36_01500 [SAR324 cluster bacterium]|nr:hypothetical protein [SAR324 cluster bacterium]
MKQLSIIMLVAVASVTLAAPAFAWDFSASGSATAKLNQTTIKENKDANARTGGGFASEGGGISLKSAHSDGAASATLTYAVDWADGGLDETLSVSGSKKVGNWSASAGTSFNLDRYGCSTDNITNARCGQQTGEDSTSVTLTDGTMTIKLGDAAHLSSQNVSTSSAAAGAVSFDTADDDASVGAFVGSYEGVSLGYKISDTMSATVAYQTSSAVTDACGLGDNAMDSDTGATYGISGTGLSFNGTFGTIGVGATVCNAATADKGTASTSPVSNSTAYSTMGIGITMDMGDIKPFLSIGSYSAEGSQSKSSVGYSGNELGLTYALGNDTIVFYYGSKVDSSTTSGTAAEDITTTGLELGYNTTVGPAALGIGYGSQSVAQTDGAGDGGSMTDIEFNLSYSF